LISDSNTYKGGIYLLDNNYTGITKLKDWWGKVKANFTYLDDRISTIITTPVDGVSAQEIIDARKGELALGDKIDAMDLEVSTHLADNTAHGLETFIPDTEKTIARINDFVSYKEHNPAFIEQHMTTWYGRGLLTAELPHINSDSKTTFSSNYSAGTFNVTVPDAAKFVLGSIVAIEYPNGKHFTHFIYAKSGNQISIVPSLRYDVTTSSRIERAWYNSAHMGEFAGKYIAEQIAEATIDNYGSGKLLYELTFDDVTGYNAGVAVGSATVGTNAESSCPGGNYASALNSVSGNGGYAVCTAQGAGIKTKDFDVPESSKIVVRGFYRSASNPVKVELISKDGIAMTAMTTNTLSLTDGLLKRFAVVFYTNPGVNSCHVKISQASASNTSIYLDDIKVIECVESANNQYLIPRTAKIVLLFDSWGSFLNNVIATRLAELMPDATIINESVGGNTSADMSTRFDADVAPHAPDVVLMNPGVNDAYYNSPGGDDTNYQANLMYLTNKCKGIGALPVFLGIPALAESDPLSEYVSFQLTDKSRAMSAKAERGTYKASSYKAKRNIHTISLPIDNLATGSSKSFVIGSMPAGTLVTINSVGGYSIAATTKVQLGFSTNINDALIGSANSVDISTTNYFEYSSSGFQQNMGINIKNNEATPKLLVLRFVNTSGSAYTGSVLIDIEI
jgi:hypothetical protein